MQEKLVYIPTNVKKNCPSLLMRKAQTLCHWAQTSPTRTVMKYLESS